MWLWMAELIGRVHRTSTTINLVKLVSNETGGNMLICGHQFNEHITRAQNTRISDQSNNK